MKKTFLYLTGLIVILVAGGWYLVRNNRPNTLGVESDSAQQETAKIVFSNTSTPSAPTRLVAKVMKDRGIDKKYGFELETIDVPPTERFNSLISGSIDIGAINPVAAVRANVLSEEKIQMFGRVISHDVYVGVMQGSNINTLDDLKGKKVGSVNPSSIIYSMTNLLFEKLEYSWKDDFEIIVLPFPALVPALESGDVDAIITPLPNPGFASLLTEDKAKSIFSFRDNWKDQVGTINPYNGFAAYDSWLNEHRDEAANFVKAWNEAINYVLDNMQMFDDPEFQEQISVPSNQISQYKEIFKRVMSITKWTESEIEGTQDFIKQMIEIGAVPKDASSDLFVLLN